ncbi:DUF488 domain-containing protein [Anoxynatronum sibiricum]|uniref:DUF488 domain-containing protein n=1 Tax=Anoxynatronum sibiricum TaxID=210623 RepID=A0ABU9VX64_9CLOT
MKIFTIGFTKKSAEEFFSKLKENEVKRVVDIRLNNSSQLAGFTKGNDLKFFLDMILKIPYEHNVKLAPTKEILSDYKNKKIEWSEYERQFTNLLKERSNKNTLIEKNKLDNVCFLCSEAYPSNCHRTLVANFVKQNYPDLDINIIHI